MRPKSTSHDPPCPGGVEHDARQLDLRLQSPPSTVKPIFRPSHRHRLLAIQFRQVADHGQLPAEVGQRLCLPWAAWLAGSGQAAGNLHWCGNGTCRMPVRSARGDSSRRAWSPAPPQRCRSIAGSNSRWCAGPCAGSCRRHPARWPESPDAPWRLVARTQLTTGAVPDRGVGWRGGRFGRR